MLKVINEYTIHIKSELKLKCKFKTTPLTYSGGDSIIKVELLHFHNGPFSTTKDEYNEKLNKTG